MHVLKWIKNNLVISILISMIIGVIVGYYVDVTWMKHLILPLTFMLVYPMMVTLNLGSLLNKWNVKLQLSTQIINFLVFPFIAYGLGLLFFQDEPYFRLGLLLIALLPTSGMTISWTVMAKGNVNEAIRMVVIGLTIGALIAPAYITYLMGEAISVPFMSIMSQILIVIFAPLLIAFITQKVLIKKYGKKQFHTVIKPVFPLFSTLGVVLIILVAIALKAPYIVNNPMMIISIIIPLIILYVSFILITIITAKLFFNREDGIALVNGTLIRNLSVSLAITLSAFSGAGLATLLIAIAYALQVQFAAWNVKLSDKIFKPEEEI